MHAAGLTKFETDYKPVWERFVMLNYMMYAHVLSLFFKRMAECDYSSGNEEALALIKVPPRVQRLAD